LRGAPSKQDGNAPAGIPALAALYHHFIRRRSWPECCCRETGSGRILSCRHGLAVVPDRASTSRALPITFD
ncbi:hypothetical protein, partial [Mesorhizobium sp.]|uniref:hypothetical protein n=1 Tax=Mesorhizobium sp. TaxID=1871066 RepID=UPI0025F159B6